MDLSAAFESVQARIRGACARAGRPPESVELLAVTKGQPPDRVRQAVDLGIRLFGENRVQEAKIKIGQCPGSVRWHMIGHVQSNKARDAVRLFEMIQSVDSLHLAQELDRCAAQRAKSIPILLEVNAAGESTKFGFSPVTLLEQLPQLNQLARLEIHGLMTIAPWTPAPEKVRPIFRHLAELRRQCEQILGAPLAHLSMGMSGDFEVAVEEGATLVRIGSALFGPR